MDFRRSGSRDERRRRVLMDDALAEKLPTDEPPPPVKRSKPKSDEGASSASPYPPGAVAEGQPQLTALLPQRKLTLWIWLLAASMAISLSAVLHVQSVAWSERIPQVNLSPLRMDAPGGFGAWLSSLVLLWAAFASVQVYLIRRRRSDDYRGGYRLWIWSAGVLIAASIAAATTTAQMIGGLVAHLCAMPEYGEWFGLALVSAMGGGFAIRMVWEIRPSRGATTSLVVAGCCHATALAAKLEWLFFAAPWEVLLTAVSAMAGHVFVLLAVGAFGRYIRLEACGELVQRPRKQKTKAERPAQADAKRSSAKKRTAKTDLDAAPQNAPAASESAAPREKPSKSSDKRQETPKATPEKKAASPATVPAKSKTSPASSDVDDADEDGDESDNLSKAERRRLRKQRRQDKRAA